jgi:hypothetical protein
MKIHGISSGTKPTPGKETPITLDESDVPDSNLVCMRKQLTILNTMMKNGTHWNEKYA